MALALHAAVFCINQIVTFHRDGKMYNEPVAYFITFSTYGTRLHGDSRGTVFQHRKKKKLIGHEPKLQSYKSALMRYPEVNFDKLQRKIVLDTIIQHCRFKSWKIFALHVRSNHVHILVNAGTGPEKVMNQLKSWSTRKLRQAGYNFEKTWTRHGSTVFVFKSEKLRQKVRYIILEQGEMMEYYLDRRFELILKQ